MRIVRTKDNLEHRWARRRFSAYLDGDLAPRPRRRLERHAGRCPDCRALLRSLSRLLTALRDLRRPHAPSVAPSVIRCLRRRAGAEDGTRP